MKVDEALARLRDARDNGAELDKETLDVLIAIIEKEKQFNSESFMRDIKGYEGIYKASAFGEIYSLRNNRFLTQTLDRGGYLKCSLYKDKKTRNVKIHKLIAESFLGERPYGTQINHIDENKLNNCIWNLEYVTASENVNHGTRNERVAEKLKNNVVFSKPIKKCDLSGNVIESYPSISEASRQTGIAQSNISRSVIGRRRTAGGFLWKLEK